MVQYFRKHKLQLQKTQITTSENINYNFKKQYVHKAQKTKTLVLEKVKIHLKGYRYQLFSYNINLDGDICIKLIIC